MSTEPTNTPMTDETNTMAPTIDSIAITSTPDSDNTYMVGSLVEIAVTMNEAVIVTGNPSLDINIGGNKRSAHYISGSGTQKLVFSYRITNNDGNDTDGISIVADSLKLNTGSITDLAGNAASATDLNHVAQTDNAYHKVDTSKSVIASVFSGFVSVYISSEAADSRGAVAADFNGDGYTDLYVANTSSSAKGKQNRLWINDDKGNFTSDSDTISDNSDRSYDAVAADFNGDDCPDLYVANYFGQNRLWLSDGIGNFTSADISGDTGNSQGAVAADFDGDGDIDIYVANYGQQNRLWLGDGMGSFTASTDISSNSDNSYAAVTADFDGDGKTDIYIANNYGQNRLWLSKGAGAGAGGFTSADISGDTGSSDDAVTADFNNDGNIDIYVANNNQNRLWLGDGDGGFDNADISGDTGSSNGAVAKDFNNDGNTDIYVANYNQNRLWLGNGAGGFTATNIIGDTSYSLDAVAADFNNDGNTDIYVANYYEQNRLWLQGNSATSNSISIVLGTDATAGSTLSLYSGTELELIASKLLTAKDISAAQVFLTVGEVKAGNILKLESYVITNIDGDFILKPGSHNLTAKVTSTDGSTVSEASFDINIEFIKPTVDTLTTNNTTPTLSGTTGGYKLQSNDILSVSIEMEEEEEEEVMFSYDVSPNANGTWELDLHSATPTSGNFTALDDGTYSVTASIQYAGQTSDDDKDKTADNTNNELIIDTSPPSITAILASHFVPAPNISSHSNSSYATVAADFNNDGNTDIYVTNWGQNYLWLGNSDGTFDKINISGDTGSSEAAVEADFDKDGDIDIYVVNYGQNILWLNDNNVDSISFTAYKIDGDTGDSRDVVIDYFNEDTYLDIYVVNHGPGQNRLWLNNGEGGFDNADISGDIGTGSGVATADFNGDGNIDIYVANSASYQNRLWLGDGNGGFTTSYISGDGGNSRDAVTADFNNDGHIDIYTTNFGQNRLWLNDGEGGFDNADISGDTGSSNGAVPPTSIMTAISISM